jgi:glycosyltransferase involved in cell wall biosynthesis
MKVLFYTHSTAYQMFGGMEVQMINTKSNLENLGVYVKNYDMYNDKIDNFEILHTFGSYSYETVPMVNLTKNKDKIVVLSPVYWNSRELNLQGEDFNEKIRGMAAETLRHIGKKCNIATLNPTNYLLEKADIILPNSKLEANNIIREFGISKEKIHVIPNGVEKRFSYGSSNLFVEKFGIKDFVLFTGRIEKKKNVLNLIRAFSNLNIPLVIIGNPTADLNYYDSCQKSASNNVIFLGHLDHESDLLSSAYSAAKVFVLPSWLETPGISALEAGLSGCNIVITDRGSTKEYFENFVTYCNPASVRSIKEAIEIEYNKPKTDDLKDHILSKFTWDRVAEKTLEAYISIKEKNV